MQEIEIKQGQKRVARMAGLPNGLELKIYKFLALNRYEAEDVCKTCLAFEKDGKRHYSFWPIFYDFGHSEAVWLISSYFVLTLSKKNYGENPWQIKILCIKYVYSSFVLFRSVSWVAKFQTPGCKISSHLFLYRTCAMDFFLCFDNWHITAWPWET